MTHSEHHMAIDVNERRYIVARGVRLEYVTVGWNVLEGAVAIVVLVVNIIDLGTVSKVKCLVDYDFDHSCPGKIA
jgi:hypothetical protein